MPAVPEDKPKVRENETMGPYDYDGRLDMRTCVRLWRPDDGGWWLNGAHDEASMS